MLTQALVPLLADVVVPVHIGGGGAGGPVHGQHGQRAHDVALAGGGLTGLAHHAHGQAGGAAVVVLQRVPALDGAGVAVQLLHQLLHGQAEPGLLFDLLRAYVGRDGAVCAYLGGLFIDERRVPDGLRAVNDGGHVHGLHVYARALEQLFGEAHRPEGRGTHPEQGYTRGAQGLCDPAHCGKALYVGAKLRRVYPAGVGARVREGYAQLIEVVADGELAAEGVPPVGHVQLVEVVVAGLHQHGHLQAGELYGVRHGRLLAKVRQDNDDAAYELPVPGKQPGAGQCLLMRLDGAHTAAVLVHAYAAVAHTVQQAQHTVPGFLYEVRGEEAAGGHDKSKCLFHPDMISFRQSRVLTARFQPS